VEAAQATLDDGSSIELVIGGSGYTLLLPVNPTPVEGPRADEMRRWGADPALGRSLIEALRDVVRVVAFDYEGHLLATPRADTLTPDAIVRDLLAVGDAADAERFAYYGYSWLAVAGLQLAAASDRVLGLAMGGYPPIDGPYEEMLRVTTATHEAALTTGSEPAWTIDRDAAADPSTDDPDWSSAEMTLSEEQTRQFVTLYRALQDFDDRAIQARLTCPRLCFVGSSDVIVYDERWGGVTVDLAGPVVRARHELRSLGWDVLVLDVFDHIRAMQAATVVPMLRSWLTSTVVV
jgi:pimeloyl-ACP methyl ester carboxylesterase